MIGRVLFPNCRSGVIGLAIAGNPENDGHLSRWQEAVGHEIIPDTHKNGRANDFRATFEVRRSVAQKWSGEPRNVSRGGKRGNVIDH